jgi:predicted nucleic acid-binding protein
MILADSSVWIDFFRNKQCFEVDLLIRSVTANRIIVADLVVAEVLQGIDTEREFREVEAGFANFDCIRICDRITAVQAARNYRILRTKGVTVRKTIDTLIATRCIIDGLELLHSDSDFDPFVEHLGLMVPAGALPNA